MSDQPIRKAHQTNACQEPLKTLIALYFDCVQLLSSVTWKYGSQTATSTQWWYAIYNIGDSAGLFVFYSVPVLVTNLPLWTSLKWVERQVLPDDGRTDRYVILHFKELIMEAIIHEVSAEYPHILNENWS